MRYVKKFFESKDNHLNQIEELCVWIKDEVDSVKIETNGRYYSIEIIFKRDNAPVETIIENAEIMLKITKEYYELLLKLQDIGYDVSYHLLTTTQHLDFFNLKGIIQIAI